MSRPSVDDQVALLMQGTEYGDDALRQAMATELRDRLMEAERNRKRLRVYCGFDPRTSDLHLGHCVPMRKMRQFQELDHEVIFVVGRYTALIGDPSDKDVLRNRLTPEAAQANAETYAAQAFKILDPGRTEFRYNDTWLSKLRLRDLIELGANFTVQQFLSRETFRKRWDAGDPIHLHEFFYAIMQAYDAYHLRADVQIGGSDQLFNIITAGRKLMETMGVKPNIGIILGILPGTDGVVKMSKSLGNHIPLTSTPREMYGKVMSVPDQAMGSYFRLATRWTPPEIAEIESGLLSGDLHPKDAKMSLAREIVSVYHGDEEAKLAEEEFRRVFQEKSEPLQMSEVVIAPGTTLVQLLVESDTCHSSSEARRLIDQGAVKLDDVILRSWNLVLDLHEPKTLKVGRRRFLRLIPTGQE